MTLAEHLSRGFEAFGREDYKAAADQARAALKLAPQDPGARTLLGRLAQMALRPDVGRDVFQGLAVPGAPADTWLDLARALIDLRLEDDAIAAAQRAVEINPRSYDGWAVLGDTLQSVNLRDEATEAFRRALALRADEPSMLRRLARLGLLTPMSPETQRMEALAQKSGAGSADLHYGLSAIYKRAGEPQKFIEHLLAANAAQKATSKLDRGAYERACDRLELAFTAKAMARAHSADVQTPTPIFVTGMPRSGTTLVEQILGGVPSVASAGELKYRYALLPREMQAITGRPFPEGWDTLSSQQMNELAAPLTHLLSAIGRGAPLVTDKSIDNREIQGLLLKLFPAAKIVLLRRDPMDVCFSILQQQFEYEAPHSFDMDLLGYFYGRHMRLMRRWEELIGDRRLEVCYEDLVAHPREQGRRLVEYCGFTWDDALLDFYKRDAGVRTFSNEQVRRPIYTDSVGAWRPFASQLEPLLQSLRSNGVSFDE